MYKINEVVDIVVTGQESNFDRACDAAYNIALSMFGIDDYGHSNNVEGFQRSTDVIVVEFKSYKCVGSMVGHEHQYMFKAWVERNSEE